MYRHYPIAFGVCRESPHKRGDVPDKVRAIAKQVGISPQVQGGLWRVVLHKKAAQCSGLPAVLPKATGHCSRRYGRDRNMNNNNGFIGGFIRGFCIVFFGGLVVVAILIVIALAL